jgi:hypothetical protein
MLKRYLGLAAKQATVRYWGTTEAGRKAQFEADAVVRAAAGWRAIHKITEWPVNKPGLDLVVTYEMEAAEDEATPAGDPPRPATSRGGPNRVAAVRIALSRALPYVCYALFFAGVANFLWFCAEGLTMGDALNGYQSGDHYFVLVKPGYREVSQATWEWLRFHGTTALAGFGAAFVGGFIGCFVWFGRELSGGITREERARREAIVRDSGPLLASGRTSAAVGGVFLGFPGIVRVAVYPGGVLMNLPFRPCHSILTSEIRLVSGSLLIEHDGVESKSPWALGTRYRDRLGSAILALPYAPRDPGPSAPWAIRHPWLSRAFYAAGALVGSGVRRLHGRPGRQRLD